MLQKIIDSPGRLFRFYGDVRGELRKVTWPGRKEIYGTTTVVVVTMFFFGIYLYIVDFILNYAVDFVQQLFQ